MNTGPTPPVSGLCASPVEGAGPRSSASVPAPDPWVTGGAWLRTVTPAMIGGFRIGGVLGSGGMSVVARAYHPEHGSVALKLVGPAQGDEHVGRLQREGELLSRLRHPAVPRLYAQGRSGDWAYLALELRRGQTFRRWCAEPRSVTEIVRVVARLCDALERVHADGVVHRDLNDTNVLVDGDEVSVLDFGASAPVSGPRMTCSEALAPLTLAHAAPEQLIGAAATPAMDVYGVGTLLRAALARGSTGRGHARLARLARRALAYEPEQRFPTAKAFARALRRPMPNWWLTTGGLLITSVALATAMPAREPIATPHYLARRAVVEAVAHAARTGEDVGLGGALDRSQAESELEAAYLVRLRGEGVHRSGDHRESRRLFEQALALEAMAGFSDPQQATRTLRGWSLLELGNPELAVSNASEGLRIVQEGTAAWARLSLQLGAALRTLGRRSDSIEILRDVLGKQKAGWPPRLVAHVAAELGRTQARAVDGRGS